ncbi:phosphoglycerate dehydrogenase [Vampirovibrio sp.]|uniref:phosphoglycerate dehydrogenase n=1 Tax=Vampirovibrio sp. TaxID=2717857 RepID=UPI003594464B
MRKPVVLITDSINPKAAEILEESCEVIFEPKLSHQELLDRIADVDALMIRSASTVSADILEKAKRLRIVGRAGVGTDNVDVVTATKQGVIVINSPEGNTVAASEHTIGLLMALARHIPEGDATLKSGQWIRSKLVGVEVYGKTLGVVGLGKIGRRVAKACLAMGMKVNVFDPFLSKAMAEELGVNVVSIDDIIEKSDFITIHAPKTKETQNLFNRDTFARCKPGVRLINCARGGIIHEADLADAIRSGMVAGAALDVFEQEPPDMNGPLFQLGEHANKLVLTPHLGASTEEAQVNVALDVAEQIKDFFQHGFARSAVNIPLLRQDLLDPIKHFMPMAEVLGNFIRQRAQSPAQAIEIIAKGDLSKHRIEPLTLAVLKGLLSNAKEGVNYVNAPSIAEESGIQVKTTTTKAAGNYRNLLEIKLITEEKTYMVAGTLISDEIFRIVDMDGYQMALKATPYVLITPHHDRPGMIAQVATVLGEAGVNISALQVARSGPQAGGESIMVFNLDNAPSDSLLSKIRELEGIYGSSYINL